VCVCVCVCVRVGGGGQVSGLHKYKRSQQEAAPNSYHLK